MQRRNHRFAIDYLENGLDGYFGRRGHVVAAHNYARIFLFRTERHNYSLARRHIGVEFGRYRVGKCTFKWQRQQYVGKIHINGAKFMQIYH